MKKTKVKVIGYNKESIMTEGIEGYIDGYIMGTYNVPYAVVVSGEFIDMIPLDFLRVIDGVIWVKKNDK